MITAKGLQQLGFVSQVDFRLRDDGDGPFIEEWISDQQQPTVADIEVAHAAWENDYARKGLAAYEAAGCTISALAIATFESVFADDSSAAVRLQVEREKIKADTQAFLDSGGKIDYIAHNVFNDKAVQLSSRQKIQWKSKKI